MQGFLQYEGLSPHQDRVDQLVGPILSVTQFPAFQMLGFESDTPSIIFCLFTGYLVGLPIGYFAGRRVTQLHCSSILWWLATVVAATDLGCICALTGNPLDTFFVFLRVLTLLVPVTLIASIAIWLRNWLRSSEATQADT